MALPAGSRLGPYEILTPLGAGGMGEVYKARDTRLDRTVAIKVLSDHVAADTEARTRLEREAKAISQLNHPHICTLYDLGRDALTDSAQPVDYLVLEYLEGETLARRLDTGPLNVADALKLAMQIADALDKAHRHGIIHRDLKPANVMVTRNGAKLLDFGLAKAATAGQDLLITRTTPLTAQGTILGTYVHVARANRGRRSRRAQRHLGVRVRVARDAHGPPRIHRQDSREPDRRDSERSTGAGLDGAAADAAGARSPRAVVPREGSA